MFLEEADVNVAFYTSDFKKINQTFEVRTNNKKINDDEF